MKYNLIHLIAGMALSGLVSADCQAENTATDNAHEDNEKLCTSNGSGTYTFGMSTSMACVPAGGSGGLSGCADGTTFYIFDEGCDLLGQYDMPDCGVPFVIMENFLSQVLTLTSVNTMVGGAYFSFKYGDGSYVIKNNGCECVDDSHGLQGGEACKCAFPQDGIFKGEKRAVKLAASFTS